MKTIHIIGACLFMVCTTLIYSCQTIPSYPPEPKIEFKQVEAFLSVENGIRKDSLVIVTRFEDGDGDLGLSEADKQIPPFNTAEGKINYFVEIFIKRNNQFLPLNLPISYNGSFFRLSPDDRIGPIEGDLRYGSFVVRENNPVVKAGDVIKFRVKIKDRRGNFSNTVESDEVVMFPRTEARR